MQTHSNSVLNISTLYKWNFPIERESLQHTFISRHLIKMQSNGLRIDIMKQQKMIDNT